MRLSSTLTYGGLVEKNDSNATSSLLSTSPALLLKNGPLRLPVGAGVWLISTLKFNRISLDSLGMVGGWLRDN
jgi:hypothetical protein